MADKLIIDCATGEATVTPYDAADTANQQAMVQASQAQAALQAQIAATAAQVRTDLATILAWLANNPNGAVLTAAQTRVLARIVANLCIYDLEDSAQKPVTT